MYVCMYVCMCAAQNSGTTKNFVLGNVEKSDLHIHDILLKPILYLVFSCKSNQIIWNLQIFLQKNAQMSVNSTKTSRKRNSVAWFFEQKLATMTRKFTRKLFLNTVITDYTDVNHERKRKYP